MPGKLYFFGLVLLHLGNFAWGQSLTAEFVDIKLPTTLYNSAPYYDGDDSIYLYGGNRINQPTSQILRFNLSTTTIDIAGRLFALGEGSVAMDSSGRNMFFFGGHNQPYYMTVFKTDLTTNSSEEVAYFPTTIHRRGISYNDKAYFFGGGELSNPRSILEFNMTTNGNKIVGHMPIRSNYYTVIRVGSKAYVFGSLLPGPDCVFVVDLDTFEIHAGPFDLPDIQSTPGSVYDGKHIYIYGGYTGEFGAPTQAIIQFNPDTLEHQFIYIENSFLQEGDHISIAPAMVFVEKMNRIYFFGGRTLTGETGTNRDDIWFIDLNQLE